MSVLFNETHEAPLAPAGRALQTVSSSNGDRPPAAGGTAEALLEAAASSFAAGRAAEARRLLASASSSTDASESTRTMTRILLATFTGHAGLLPQGDGEYADSTGTLVAWGQPLTAFAVLLAAEPCAAVRAAARSLAAKRPADCGLAAVVALHDGNFTLALQLLTEADHQAEAGGLHGVRTHIQTLLGDLLVQLGNQSAARHPLVTAIDLSARTRQTGWAARAALAEATRRILCEDPDRQAIATQAHRAALTATPALCNRAELLAAQALASDQRWADAFDVLRRLAARDVRDIEHLLPAGLLSVLADAGAHTGQQMEARILISRIAESDGHCECDIVLAELLYATAVLSDNQTAEICFEAALAMNPYRLPWHRARTSLAYGAWLRRSRRVTESRTHLLEARRIFEALDLPGWARRARVELRASGMRTHREPAGVTQLLDLSPQELEVARLVARGLTNRQIGEALHLSPRTVGSHLYRIFPKMDVTSRNQLGALLT